MTTIHTSIHTYLLADTDLTSSPCSTRIYIDVWIPDGYKATTNKTFQPVLVMNPRGGRGVPNWAIESQFVVFSSFAPSKDDAFSIDDALRDVLRKTHNPSNNTSFYALQTVSPALLREEGGLYVVTSSYECAMVVSWA